MVITYTQAVSLENPDPEGMQFKDIIFSEFTNDERIIFCCRFLALSDKYWKMKINDCIALSRFYKARYIRR